MDSPYRPVLSRRVDEPAVVPPCRWIRASVAAAAATALGLAGHLAAGGDPTVFGAVLGFLVVALPSWLLTGRERGWTVIAAVQLVAQQLVHPVLIAAAEAPEPAALPHDLMFFLHVFGALLMAAWLRLGERRLWTIAHRLAAHLMRWSRRLLHALPGPAAPRLVARPGTDPRPRLDRPLRHVVSRRGPPLPA